MWYPLSLHTGCCWFVWPKDRYEGYFLRILSKQEASNLLRIRRAPWLSDKTLSSWLHHFYYSDSFPAWLCYSVCMGAFEYVYCNYICLKFCPKMLFGVKTSTKEYNAFLNHWENEHWRPFHCGKESQNYNHKNVINTCRINAAVLRGWQKGTNWKEYKVCEDYLFN